MTSNDEFGLRKRRYAVLLALLLVALAVQTFNARGVGRFIADAFASALAIGIWFVVFERPRERAAMAGLLVATLTISWARYVAGAGLDRLLSLVDQTLVALLLWSAVFVIMRDLFTSHAAGAEKVLGAICGYIIAGDAWGRINAITYLLVPSAYSINPEVIALLPDWHGRTSLFTYYAFAQVLTIGCSDVTPVRAPATTWSLFAALFGVFYTAIVVSVFVGLAQSGKGKSGDNQ